MGADVGDDDRDYDHLLKRLRDTAEWSLRPGDWWPVVAAKRSPEVWRGRTEYTKDGPAAHLLIEGCRDRKYENGGSFFPSMLRSELHAVRSTLEQHARLAVVGGGIENATACGLRLTLDRWGVTLRVTSNGVRTLYTIDRFD